MDLESHEHDNSENIKCCNWLIINLRSNEVGFRLAILKRFLYALKFSER